MNDERDPLLEALFDDARQELTDDRYTEQVMDRIGRRRRNVIAGRLTILAFVLAFELALNAPLQSSIGALADTFSTDLFAVENAWLAAALAPLNSVAGVVGILLVGLHAMYRKFIR